MSANKIKILIPLVLILSAGVLVVIFFIFKIFIKPAGYGLSNNQSSVLSKIVSTLSPDDKPPEKNETYISKENKFQFSYPPNMTVKTIEDNDSLVVVVQNKKDRGVQLAISDWDEGEAVLTRARILKDLPYLVISDEKYIKVGGVDALSFFAKDTSFGQSREVWFVKNKKIYQISTPSDLVDVLEVMADSWRFE